jgi:hypothetical protein
VTVKGTRTGEIVTEWGDEDRTFRLGIGQWRKLQEKLDVGPGELARRLGGLLEFRRRFPKASIVELLLLGGAGDWRVDDVREVLMQGLVGGGLNPTEAGRLVRDLHDERPLLENVPLAFEIVLASFIGPEDEPLGKPQGEAEANPSPAESSASPTSTETAPS